MRTDQEVFDIALDSIRRQGTQSTRYNKYQVEVCAYRGSAGRRCPIGWMIPDEFYDLDLEGLGADAPLVREAAGLSLEQVDLAVDIQQAHDLGLAISPKAWENHMEAVAHRYGLVYMPAEVTA